MLQMLDGVKHLALRSLLAGKKLHVINQKNVRRAVVVMKRIHGVESDALQHVVDEVFGAA